MNNMRLISVLSNTHYSAILHKKVYEMWYPGRPGMLLLERKCSLLPL